MHTHAGLDEVHGDQPDYQRQRRHNLEVDQCLDPHPTDLLEIAMPGNAHNKRCEDERRNNRFDEPEENRTERPERNGDIREDPPDDQAESHAYEYPLRKSRFAEIHELSFQVHGGSGGLRIG